MSLQSSDTFKKTGNTNLTYEEFIEDLAEKYRNSPIFTKAISDESLPELDDKFVHQRKYKASCLRQFVILTERSMLNCARQIKDQCSRIVGIILLGLFMICLYYDVFL